MRSSGLITQNFQIMTNDNKQQKLSDSTDTAIAYSTCYLLVRFITPELELKTKQKELEKRSDGNK